MDATRMTTSNSNSNSESADHEKSNDSLSTKPSGRRMTPEEIATAMANLLERQARNQAISPSAENKVFSQDAFVRIKRD